MANIWMKRRDGGRGWASNVPTENNLRNSISMTIWSWILGIVVFLDFTLLKLLYLEETYDTVVEDGRSNVPIVNNLRISISMKSYGLPK